MHKENSRIAVLAETPVLKAIVTMALPVMLGMIVQVLYNLVDTFFIGLMNDVSQLAAANLGFPYFMITMAVGSVIGVGASSAISRFLGMKKNKEAGETAGLSMILVVLAGAAFTVFGLIFLEPLLFQGRDTGQQFVQNHAKGKHVGVMGQLFFAYLLWRHVGG